MPEHQLIGLGTWLRHLLDEMDAGIASVLADLGTADFRPRFSPVVRALTALGPVPIRDLAAALAVTHSAASQTVTQLAERGYVTLQPGEDARQRVVHLTAKARALLPVIDAEWAATASAAAELDAELPFPLADLVPAIAAALERRPFRQRMAESAWAASHPEFTAALNRGDHGDRSDHGDRLGTP